MKTKEDDFLLTFYPSVTIGGSGWRWLSEEEKQIIKQQKRKEKIKRLIYES